MTERALVLGGGGLAGIAWETGVLAALHAAGAGVAAADFLLGTSAGATVAAQLGSGVPLVELLARQADPARQTAELTPDPAVVARVMESWEELGARAGGDPAGLRREIGAMALAASTVPEATRLAVIAGRLPATAWPGRALSVVAVDAHSGEPRVFTRDSGVSLAEAVAASSAVPGIWPPVTIGGRRYVDGGVRSAVNADLAAGYPQVLILVPMADPALDEQVAGLARAAEVEVISADDEAVAAFGVNALDPAVRDGAAQAGYAQGERVAARISSWWPA
jgi:NTE family protein